ncbi:sensor histidine kinase [Lactiplantibacillus mudanjiangensis]|uniref:histidine kinase n=1 Tax=Lactiplantibacillus mudanjiangensis TaxID=1296538 RepID=A0A660E1W9_9LACO|nr:histidine kinase [Lactobacillus koreensis] [Lactiplantibacillus mudanjiangensis]VDG23424.1 histidine kinase [Lactobacillus koreensis] [Lactiplantibacillus mudanjiangensis]VDG28582.1 histidine kinase [Lactobacillus koreensis] [Lactiplantibacillus mudanjiangensis]
MSKHKWWTQFKNIEWTSYIWLGYLPYSISMFVPVKGIQDWFWLGMLAVFLVLYILVVEKGAWRRVTVPLELLVTGLFSVIGLNNYLIIYPGWQVSFILGKQSPKRYFYWFISGYYAFIGISLIRAYLVDPQLFSWQNGGVMGLIFPLISPLMSYTFARSIARQRQLRQSNRRLQTYIQRNERERIARDLHDTLGQSFSMITLKTELAQKLLVKAPDRVAGELADIAQTSRQNLQLVRSIVNDLHRQSISEALLIENQNLVSAGVGLNTSGEDLAVKWPTATQGLLSAVLVEAITNVIRHAQANSVQITFSETKTTYQVQLTDDGRGGKLSRPGSNGIQGMQTRMNQANGTFDITANHRGTQIQLSLPKEV